MKYTYRLLLAALLFVPAFANAQTPGLVDCNAANATNAAALTLTAPAGLTDGHLITIDVFSNQNTAGPMTGPAEFEEVYNIQNTTNGTWSSYSAWKFADSESGDYTVDAATSAIQLTGFICAWENVRPEADGGPWDVAFSVGDHFAHVVDPAGPAQPASITTVNNNAMVYIAAYVDNNTVITDFTESSGYTLPNQNIAGGRMSMLQYLLKATLGTETPGTLEATDIGTTNDNWVIYTKALAPPIAATFDTDPALVSCADTGCTFSYDADAVAETIHGMFRDVADTAPTCAEIEAQTRSHGYQTDSVTGSSDTITITSTDNPEHTHYNAYFCLEEGVGNYSVLKTVEDVFLDAPAGWQFITPVSLEANTMCSKFNDQVEPNMTIGDMLVAPLLTSPGVEGYAGCAESGGGLICDGSVGNNSAFLNMGNVAVSWIADQFIGLTIHNNTDGSSCQITDNTTNTVVCTLTGGAENDWDKEDQFTIDTALTIDDGCHAEYSGDGTRQSALNILVFDTSVGAYHAEDIDFWDNNAVPVCSNLADIVIPIDAAITEIDLDDQCADSDGDLLDFTSDTLPSGVTHGATTDSNLLNGTPDTEEEISTTFTGEDVAETVDTFTVNWCVYGSYTMIDLANGTVEEAETALDGVIPCSIVPSFTQTGAYSDTVAVGDIISHTPAESAEVDDPFAPIALVVSLGVQPEAGSNRTKGVNSFGLSIGP